MHMHYIHPDPYVEGRPEQTHIRERRGNRQRAWKRFRRHTCLLLRQILDSLPPSHLLAGHASRGEAPASASQRRLSIRGLRQGRAGFLHPFTTNSCVWSLAWVTFFFFFFFYTSDYMEIPSLFSFGPVTAALHQATLNMLIFHRDTRR